MGAGMAVIYGFYVPHLSTAGPLYLVTGAPALALIPLGMVFIPGPVALLVPPRMVESPDPKTRREIDNFHVRLGSLRHGGMIARPPARNCHDTPPMFWFVGNA